MISGCSDIWSKFQYFFEQVRLPAGSSLSTMLIADKRLSSNAFYKTENCLYYFILTHCWECILLHSNTILTIVIIWQPPRKQ